MSDKIVVPVLGESITEATVAKWLKSKGDSVEADEPVVELETDKVNLEVPSPSDGVLSEINAQNGSTVEVGAVLGSIIGGSSKKDETENEPKEEKKVVHNEDNIKANNNQISYIGRSPDASPATGYAKTHNSQQQEIIKKVFKN